MKSTRYFIAGTLLLGAGPSGHALAAQETGARPPVVTLGGGAVRLEPTVRLQIDSRGILGAAPDENEDADALDVARKRIGLKGRVGKRVSFELESELERGAPWRDAFVDYRAFESVRVQAGQFKVPFSLDRGTSSTRLDFASHSLAATVLAPRREQGLMIHGRVARKTVRYEAGIFRRDTRATLDAPEGAVSGRTAAFRVTAFPFAAVKSLADLQAAVAMTLGEVSAGLSSVRGRNALGERFLPSADYWVAGTRRRTGLELRWRPGPFSLASEYIQLTDERRTQAVDGSDLSPLAGAGWYLSGSWVVTGESKKKLDDGPRRPLFHGGAGALELAARVEQLEFGSRLHLGPPSTDTRADHVARRTDRELTLGVNWLPHRSVRVQANLVRDAAATESSPSPGPSWGRMVRLQFSL